MGEDLNAEQLIKKIHGSVSLFCESHKLGYYQVLRALKSPTNEAYLPLMKKIGELLLSDAQSIKFIDDDRSDIKVKVIINDGSIKVFSEKHKVDYHKVWRFLTGRCYNMGSDLRAAFISAGYIDGKT